MTDLIRTSRLTILTISICVVFYSVLVLATASIIAPEKRFGSLIRDKTGAVIGSRLIAQGFTREEYFWPRPSAVDYNASAAGGSNYSPTNPELTKVAASIITRLSIPDDQTVPADLVSMSGSGLDPHISLSAALLQVDRVARARSQPRERIEELVRGNARSESSAIVVGSQLVNVLELNIGLDALGQ